ncbi:uncharacterized protein LOC111633114 [Centruroides sculpturatus]|uniref:uncharacterized protein LOC111633114 n=1 Tax=Centruroides sculpturatus TaxID=218467 RepID=UPI000C6D48BE|nr:uncharacterized protein LOC111633114 [Centruroides sculpturatus]
MYYKEGRSFQEKLIFVTAVQVIGRKMFRGVVLLVVLAASSMAELTADSYIEMAGNEIYRDRIKQEPTYFVLASKIVRPGQIFRVVVIIYSSTNPMTVRASIHRDGVELASSSQECKLKTPETLLLKIDALSPQN